MRDMARAKQVGSGTVDAHRAIVKPAARRGKVRMPGRHRSEVTWPQTRSDKALTCFRRSLSTIIRALFTYAPVAKLDKAPVYETGDYRFESCRVRHILDGDEDSAMKQAEPATRAIGVALS